MNRRAHEILTSVFGFREFRPDQSRVIEKVLSGEDTLAVMPTGGGKSLCYQIPALIFDGLTLVISPLISLMRDQVDQLLANGVSAAVLNSSLPLPEYRDNAEMVRSGRAKLLYLAPETLMKPNVEDLLNSITVSAVAVDEAHCISAWGHDFRPEYRQLARIRHAFPGAVWLALTATATPRVREDIMRTLEFTAANLVLAGFDRPNLFIEVVPKFEARAELIRFVGRFSDASGIVYCRTRRTAVALAETLSDAGISALPYHAGLNADIRNRNQRLFVTDDVLVITATVAFGMGIDKPDVRFIVHYDLPKDIESYYQEIGRAGRDGLDAHCRLMFDPGDAAAIRGFFAEKSVEERKGAERRLQAMLDFATISACRRIRLLGYFGETVRHTDCGRCDICRKPEGGGTDLTVPAQKFLSCVYRTEQRFGAAHVADVLVGANTKKIRQFNHAGLSTYGIGTEFDRRGWRILAIHLLQRGYLEQHPVHRTLSLTPAAWRIFRNEEPFFADMEIAAEPTADASTEAPVDNELFQLLRARRKELADAAEVPPFVIFSDRSLRDMALRFPQTRESFAAIHGVGAAKLERYADIFVSLIRDYCKARGIAENLSLDTTAILTTERPARKTVRGKRCQAIGERFNEGATLEELAAEVGIKPETVVSHMRDYLLSGGSFSTERLRQLAPLPPSLCDAVLEFFRENGAERLKPAFLHFEEVIPYDALHYLRVLFYAEFGIPTAEEANSANDDTRRIVCLANSRKFGGRCVAGKRLHGDVIGEWVRPVSGADSGELDKASITLDSGGMPALGDILVLRADRAANHDYQRENVRMKPVGWQKEGVFPPDRLEALLDTPKPLWQSGYSGSGGVNDRVPVEAVQKTATQSLRFIKPDAVTIHVIQGPNGLKQVRAEFIHQDERYRLVVTDADVEVEYMPLDFGAYPLPEGRVYLCISLGEPHEGFCYKLVAGLLRV